MKWKKCEYLICCNFTVVLQQENLAGNKLEREVGEIVSLQAETSPFQLREHMEHIDKSVT